MTDRKPGPDDKWIEGFDWKGGEKQIVHCLDCHMDVSFPFGQRTHGTHRILVPQPAVEEPELVGGGTQKGQQPETVTPIVTCSACEATYDTVVPFCSQCGTEIAPPDPYVLIESLRQEVTALRSELGEARNEHVSFEKESHSAISSLRSRTVDSAPTKFNWRTVPSNEKWTIAWGVWWRTFVAGLAIYALLFVIILTAASGNS